MYKEMARRPKGNYKADNVNLRPPQLQFFKYELTITATDTIIIRGNESNNIQDGLLTGAAAIY